jgi:transcriptional regulator with XRE-family HTH domain
MRDTSAFYRRVGENIRGARLKLHKSQDELAMSVGMQRASISNIEKGRQRMLIHTLAEIARALETEPSNLLPAKLEPAPIPSKTEKTLANLSQKERTFIEDAVGFRKQTKTKRG